ncbi:MAG: hypothetical protein PHI98_13275 [Eubacteriales bacterium]|nr:hypothetical protein [Eubacteriales bacterium]
MKDNHNQSKCYDDIIHLKRPISQRHPPMSIQNRAAQFAPFAALTGHESAIIETARLTDRRITLTEEEKQRLNDKLLLIQEQSDDFADVLITYFVPDPKKAGGAYHFDSLGSDKSDVL